MTDASQREIRTERLVVTDAAGRTRVVLGSGPDDRLGIYLLNEEGHVVASVSGGKDVELAMWAGGSNKAIAAAALLWPGGKTLVDIRPSPDVALRVDCTQDVAIIDLQCMAYVNLRDSSGKTVRRFRAQDGRVEEIGEKGQ